MLSDDFFNWNVENYILRLFFGFKLILAAKNDLLRGLKTPKIALESKNAIFSPPAQNC